MLDFNDPFVKRGCTILYNKLLEAFEPTFSYTHSGMEEYLEQTATGFAYSAETGGHFLPNESDVDALLIAFERFVSGSPREYMLMGIAGVTEKYIYSTSVVAGDAGCVGWPSIGIRELRRRLEAGDRCRIISVHNHPSGVLHDLLSLLQMTPPGPSSRDRDAATKILLSAVSERRVVPEFYLVEAGKFRRFKYPSWEAVSRTARLLLEMFDRVGARQ